MRTFAEIGAKNILSNLIVDTFEAARCIHTSLPRQRVVCFPGGRGSLYALGYVQPAQPAAQVTLPRPAPAPAPAPRPTPAGMTDNRAAAVMQREINTFILDTFGKYLKPAILEAIRREWTPPSARHVFEELFNTSLPAGPALAAIPRSNAAGTAVQSVPKAAAGHLLAHELIPRRGIR